MKAHKRLMQSLRDAKPTAPAREWKHINIFQATPKAPPLCACQMARVLKPGDLDFRGTSIYQWDGESWRPHRLPGMHRRGGRWVAR